MDTKRPIPNFPTVDIEILADFMKENFYAPKIRCIKATRNRKATYGNFSVGYVQLKRSLRKRSVVAAVAPDLHFPVYMLQSSSGNRYKKLQDNLATISRLYRLSK